MGSLFSQPGFIVKRQGLAIAGKYRILPSEGNDPLYFVEVKTKWIPPSVAVHIYTDENKSREVLTLKDRPGAAEDMDVMDAATNRKIGSLVMSAESTAENYKDAWSILDADGKPIGKVVEPKLGKALVRELISNEFSSQHLLITIGEIEVGELRQKKKPLGYELAVDLSKDVSSLLDERMALAIGILMAVHQGNETN